ncbi:unnamed protein product [Allacma fusca]|uniref:Uncharacterized protein n=1 Tax=Allacma fusca TaxID=39272 RepID=A0A8J2KKH0_9HEXA|nr:unnamed protein product [Allacma fusca]
MQEAYGIPNQRAPKIIAQGGVSTLLNNNGLFSQVLTNSYALPESVFAVPLEAYGIPQSSPSPVSNAAILDNGGHFPRPPVYIEDKFQSEGTPNLVTTIENSVPAPPISNENPNQEQIQESNSAEQNFHNSPNNGFENAHNNPNNGFENAHNSPNNGFENAHNNPNNGFENAHNNPNNGFENAHNSPNNGFENAHNIPNNGFENVHNSPNEKFENSDSTSNEEYENSHNNPTEEYENSHNNPNEPNPKMSPTVTPNFITVL